MRQSQPLLGIHIVFFLHLFCPPAGVCLAHVGRRLDTGDELKNDVTDTDQTDNGAGDDAQDTIVEQNRADKDIKGAAANEREEE